MTLTVDRDVTTGQRSAIVFIGSGASNAPSSPGRRMPLVVPAAQLYFWTGAWQAGEAESAGEREGGRTRTFESSTDAIRWLLSSDDE